MVNGSFPNTFFFYINTAFLSMKKMRTILNRIGHSESNKFCLDLEIAIDTRLLEVSS